MSDLIATRLSKIARELNVGISTIVDFLHNKGFKIDSNPNTKVTAEQYNLLLQEYSSDLSVKKESEKVNFKQLRERKETITIGDIKEGDIIEDQEADEEVYVKDSNANSTFETETEKEIETGENIKLNILGKIDISKTKKKEEVKPDFTEEKAVEKESVAESKIETDEDSSEEIKEYIDEAKEKNLIKRETKDVEVKVVGKIDLDSMNQLTRPPRKTKEQKDLERKAKYPYRQKDDKKSKNIQEDKSKNAFDNKTGRPDSDKDITKSKNEVQKSDDKTVKPVNNYLSDRRKKRKRIRKEKERVTLEGNKEQPRKEDFSKDKSKKKKTKKHFRPEISTEEVTAQIKNTMSRMAPKGKSKGSKYRREKRDMVSQKLQDEEQRIEDQKNILKVTEFISVNELASMMNVPVNEVIATFMNMGLFVSINQRLDAETMALVADEFDYKVEFISVEVQEAIKEEEDKPEELIHRPPIVTVMGHVDHGKTKLLDYIRDANVIAGEAGGITQHIGAYGVDLKDGRQITFLDTPGHEAFTAMRARGAQVTDVAIIVVAADDGIKPQTIEAINHAQAAGVPMVFAINKVDKKDANPEKVKEELANMNILVEDWGGKFQSQDISAKTGLHIADLLEKVLLEAEMLELKANPNKKAQGTVIESALDKGRGYLATILVQTGTLSVGDIVLAGSHTGRIKAMFNERGGKLNSAGPSSPVQILGINGAPQAGDKFNVMTSEREAKEIANKREQLQREQDMRTQKHITLDEIGRRIAIGNFQELNVIVKGDVDGSVEALSDSLIKLSTQEIQVNIIHKAVGQISESDILLAAASNAVVVGFQVRPSMQARRLAEKEQIEIRLYSIIYNAIEEVRAAMEGMLSPEIKEEIVASLEILEAFKITKVGTIAGCMVKEGKIKRTSKVRVIRDGIVVYTGMLGSLKRFKDDVKEVVSGLECGLNIDNYNDVKVGDIVEAYEEFEVKKKL